jgi:hypothetical protein
VPAPSEQPGLPLPAMELTRPEASKDLTTKLEASAMYMMREAGSMATPVGPWNSADVPTPSTQPLAPLPASVLVYQKQGGCAVRPSTLQAVAGEQGVSELLPPMQKNPTGQGMMAPVTGEQWEPEGGEEAHGTGAEAPAGQ